jgi:alpha-1,2-mannosyltransferase
MEKSMMIARSNSALAKLARDKFLFACLFVLVLFAHLYGSSLKNVNAPRSSDIQGHDYVSFYAAARLALEGHPERAYDWSSQREMQRQITESVKGGDGYREYAIFPYPPTYLTILTPFASVPYRLSLFAWLGLTAAVYLAAVYSITRSWRSLVFAAAYPVALAIIIYGQNAFLTAGLIGLALSKLNTRPWMAGVLVGVLSFKPQLGLAFPLVLFASGRWVAFFSAALTAVASVALSIVLFGTKTWEAMLGVSALNRSMLLDQGGVDFAQIETLFGALRYFDVSIGLAYTAQGALACLVAIALIWLWRSAVEYEFKAAGCIAATLLMTPFILPYDLLAVIPAVAFLVRRALRDGFRPYERAVLVLVILSPVASVLAVRTPVFLAGPLGLLLLFLWTIGRVADPTVRGTSVR